MKNKVDVLKEYSPTREEVENFQNKIPPPPILKEGDLDCKTRKAARGVTFGIVLNLLHARWTPTQIAKVYGCSEPNIYNLFRRNIRKHLGKQAAKLGGSQLTLSKYMEYVRNPAGYASFKAFITAESITEKDLEKASMSQKAVAYGIFTDKAMNMKQDNKSEGFIEYFQKLTRAAGENGRALLEIKLGVEKNG